MVIVIPVAIGDTQGTLQARKTWFAVYKRPETFLRLHIHNLLECFPCLGNFQIWNFSWELWLGFEELKTPHSPRNWNFLWKILTLPSSTGQCEDHAVCQKVIVSFALGTLSLCRASTPLGKMTVHLENLEKSWSFIILKKYWKMVWNLKNSMGLKYSTFCFLFSVETSAEPSKLL